MDIATPSLGIRLHWEWKEAPVEWGLQKSTPEERQKQAARDKTEAEQEERAE